MRAPDLVTSTPWAITEPWLHTIYEIASRENVITQDVLDKIAARREAVLTKKARLMDGTKNVQKVGSVAVIDVSGPIMRHADLFSQISGATAIESLALDFAAAVNDDSVSGIVLNFDSPGGMLSGVNEFADQVHAARGKKPILAYVPDMAASAAYWIASAADSIVVNDNAELGSIGVVITARKARDTGGIEVISSQSPRKRMAPDTEAGRAALQASADKHADVFIGRVARNRGVDVSTVEKKYGQGGMFVGQAAVDAGLADRLGSLESLISEITNGTSSRVAGSAKQNNGGSMATTQEIQAELDKANAELATAKAENKKFAEEAQTRKVEAAESDAKAFIATLTGSKDLRFGKEELIAFGELFTEAKKATAHGIKEVSETALSLVGKLEAYASKKSPVAPVTIIKPAADAEITDKLTAEDFKGESPKLVKKMDEYVAAHKLTGPNAFIEAYAALAKEAGVHLSGATPAYDGVDMSDVPEVE